MLTNWHEILLRQAPRPSTSKTNSLQPKSADTSEERFSYRLHKLSGILMLLVLLVMLLGPTLLLLHEQMQNPQSSSPAMSTLSIKNSSNDMERPAHHQ